MKYKLIGDNDLANPIEQVLNNRKIKSINNFLKPANSVCISPLKLTNITRAAHTIIRHIKEGGELFVQVDSDPQMDLHRVLN